MATDIFHGIDIHLYDMDIAPTMLTPAEARAEYVRLAKIANRRLKTIRESKDFGSSEKAQHPAFSTAASKLKTDRQVYAALQQVARFNAQKTSTLTGLRKAQAKQLETMRQKGYDWLNRNNIHEFGVFWKEVRKHELAKKVDSDRIAKLFHEAKRKRIDPQDLAKDFEFWMDHEKDLDTMKRSNSTISSDEAKERIS